MLIGLQNCGALHKCDKYFEGKLKGGLLGDLEPGEGELDYLSGLIAQELEKQSNLQGSLL